MVDNIKNPSPTVIFTRGESKFPSLHYRSVSQAGSNLDYLSRDISHRYDYSIKNKSSFENHEAQLKQILGLNQESFKMPTSLQDLQNFVKKSKEEDTKEKFIQDLENMKIQDAVQKERFLGSVIKEGGLLYRTQSGLLQPQIGKLYDQILKKSKKSEIELPKNEADLGAPSGRKEVKIIMGWLELMIQNHIYDIRDLTLEEKVRRGQLIYTACYREVIRQVSVHCLERGVLLQKIWNAQIDLNCLREDARVKEMEALKERVTTIIDRGMGEIKEKLKITEKMNEELKELIRAKDREIDSLRIQMEDIKQKNEKERLVYVDIGFHRNKNKKTSRPYQRLSVKLNEADQELKNIQEKQEYVESPTKFNEPTILLGFFDNLGAFHKQKAIQRNGDEINVNQYFDQIVLISQNASKYVMTDEIVQLDPSPNRISPQKPRVFSVNEWQQFPERINLKILRQPALSIHIIKKEEVELSSDTESDDERFHESKVDSGKYFHSKTRSEIPRKILGKAEGRVESISKNKEKVEESKGKILKESKTISNLKSTRNQSADNEIMHSNDENFSSDSYEMLENEEKTENKYEDRVKHENNLRKKKTIFSNKKKRAAKQSNGNKEKSSKNFSSTSRRNQTAKKNLRSQRELSDFASRQDFNKEILKTISKDNQDEVNASSFEEAKFIKTSNAEGLRYLSAPKQANNKLVVESSKSKQPSRIKVSKVGKDSNEKKEIMESINNKKKKSLNPSTIKKDAHNEELNVHQKNNLIEINEAKPYNKILSRSSSSSSIREKLESENLIPIHPNKNESRLRKSEIITLRKDFQPRTSVHMETIEDEYGAGTEDKSCQVLINPIPFEDLTRSQILSSIQQLKNVLEAISSDKKQREDLLKDSRSRNRGLKLEKILNSLFVIKEEHPIIIELIRNDKSSQTGCDPEDLEKTDQNTDKHIEDCNLMQPEMLRPRKNTDHGSDTENSRTSQRNRANTPLKSLIKSRTQIVFDEFLLGQVLRRVITTHPGQKLLNLVVESLRSNENIQALISLNSLMKIINLIYSEKVSLYRDNSTYKKSEAPMILYDFLTNMYGLKTVAENKFKQVVTSTIALRNKFIRIKNFSRFLGLEENYVVEDWNFYLNAFEVVEQVNIPFHFFHGVSYYSSLQRAVYCVHSIFDNKFPEEIVEEIVREVNDIRIDESELDKKSLKVVGKYSDILNTDYFLYMLLRYYIALKSNIQEALFPMLSNDLIFNEVEYLDLLKNVLNCDAEYLSKIFEIHAVLKKDDDEKISKVIRMQSILSVIVDYALIDLKQYSTRLS